MSSISDKSSPMLWRGLEELSSSAEIAEYLHREFAKDASIWGELDDETNRREFLKIMGASIALAGMPACTKMPQEKIYSFSGQENIAQGRLFFASSSSYRGYAKGVLVESHQGRPTKIEGNELHPASLGTTDIFTQAEILRLYDPQRSKGVLHFGEITSWEAFAEEIAAKLPALAQSQGEGLRILSGTTTSSILAHQISLLLKKMPKGKWHSYEPINGDNVLEGTKFAFGQDLRPIYFFDRARVVLSLDADFLGPNIAQQAYARQFIKRRKIQNGTITKQAFNRLYMIEPSVSLTGSMADHRIALKPSQMLGFATALALELGLRLEEKEAPLWTKAYKRQISIIAKDLIENAKESIVIAGEQQSPALHALSHAINNLLGNQNKTIEYIPPPEANACNQSASFKELVDDLNNNKVEVFLILGTNPAYASPKNFRFAELIKKAKLKIYLGLYEDETSYLCDWHLPESHFLESFGDLRAFDGTISFQQPLISPLYDTRTSSELLAIFLGMREQSSFKILKEYWTSNRLSEDVFLQALHDGLLRNSRFAATPAKLTKDWQIKTLKEQLPKNNLEISFKADPTVGDGVYSNISWLQELPKPILQLCWDNAALLSPKTAEKLGLKDEDKIELRLNDYHVEAPTLIVPGHPDDALTVHFGYGRTRSYLASGRGFSAFEIFNGNYFSTGVQIKNLHEKWELARTNLHYRMENRELILRGSLNDYLKDPSSIVPQSVRAPGPSLLPKRENADHAWAMVIDLNSCIGCNTCTIACQAENNIPVVGKAQVQKSREMHWIRVDRYYEGGIENPKTLFQPVPCMHCEKAPCELVCPTVATVHSSEGLNQMVYNRCIGTRYCSNNCPYKVRRFNFLQYADMKTPNMRLMYNPNVTIRSRGVMEKCTYCIQRIEEGRIKSRLENRDIKDGDITPACAQACPTEAITFGDKFDSSSKLAGLLKLPLNYSVLHELGTLPRTTYLAKLSNENPRWKKEG